MKTLSAFDVLGPVMVGPSSSHTAGAARLAAIAARIAAPDIVEVGFTLYGSFAKTYRGHGTDRALLAGILGLSPDDERLPNAYALAKKAGLRYRFEQSNAPTAHPNTVSISTLNAQGRRSEITGVSIGGGAIELTNINGVDVNITGEYPTLVVEYQDIPGMIAIISEALYRAQINIAFMRVFRQDKGGQAYTMIETDQPVPPAVLCALRDAHTHIQQVHFIEGMRA